MSTYAYLRRNAMEIHVDLRNVRSERAFLNKMKETFSLPDYFGYTLDGLDDCMQSLEWIEQKQVLAKFYHLDDVRQNNEALYGQIVDSLNLYKAYWTGNPDKKSVIRILRYFLRENHKRRTPETSGGAPLVFFWKRGTN